MNIIQFQISLLFKKYSIGTDLIVCVIEDTALFFHEYISKANGIFNRNKFYQNITPFYIQFNDVTNVPFTSIYDLKLLFSIFSTYTKNDDENIVILNESNRERLIRSIFFVTLVITKQSYLHLVSFTNINGSFYDRFVSITLNSIKQEQNISVSEAAILINCYFYLLENFNLSDSAINCFKNDCGKCDGKYFLYNSINAEIKYITELYKNLDHNISFDVIFNKLITQMFVEDFNLIQLFLNYFSIKLIDWKLKKLVNHNSIMTCLLLLLQKIFTDYLEHFQELELVIIEITKLLSNNLSEFNILNVLKDICNISIKYTFKTLFNSLIDIILHGINNSESIYIDLLIHLFSISNHYDQVVLMVQIISIINFNHIGSDVMIFFYQKFIICLQNNDNFSYDAISILREILIINSKQFLVGDMKVSINHQYIDIYNYCNF
jgi:hypothetical protein